MAAARQVQVPVTLVMEREITRHREWVYPRWRAVGVVATDREDMEGGGVRCRTVRHERDGLSQFLWSGLRLVLHRDAAESYWHNLVGRQPALFVACRVDENGDMRPCAVSADYDEAGAYMEADDTVYAVPIPPEIHRRLEEYVIEHYRPTPPRKRRRTPWTDGDRHARR